MTGHNTNHHSPCADDYLLVDEVIEVGLLLPAHLIEQLELAAERRELSTGELLRHLIASFLDNEPPRKKGMRDEG